MPRKYSIRYLPAAQDDLLSIFEYIAEDSPARALAFIEKIDKHIGKLDQHPLLGRVPRHPKLKEFRYRVLIIDSYLVFYTVHGTEIVIHRVVHGSRNLDHLI